MNAEPLHHVWQYTDFDRRFWQERLEPWVPHRLFDAHTHVNAPEFRCEEMTPEKVRPTLSLRKSTVTRLRISRSASMAVRSRRLRCVPRAAKALCAGMGSRVWPAPDRAVLTSRWTTRSA